MTDLSRLWCSCAFFHVHFRSCHRQTSRLRFLRANLNIVPRIARDGRSLESWCGAFHFCLSAPPLRGPADEPLNGQSTRKSAREKACDGTRGWKMMQRCGYGSLARVKPSDFLCSHTNSVCLQFRFQAFPFYLFILHHLNTSRRPQLIFAPPALVLTRKRSRLHSNRRCPSLDPE